MTSFSEYTLLPSLLTTLDEQGLKEPTEIQSLTIPPQLKRKPVVAVAETGSGKTLAYVLPVLHELKILDEEDPISTAGQPRGLVLVPGRELGQQVCKVFKGLTHNTRLRVRSVLGGTKKQIARQNVSGVFEVLVATPGRLAQFLDSGQLRLDDMRVVVLDEADQLLDPGFLPIVKRVLEECPWRARLALFAATLPESLDGLIGELFTAEEPLRFRTHGSRFGVSTLKTDNRSVPPGQRYEVLRQVLREDPTVGTLLFANTREQCQAVAKWLADEGLPHALYMGQMESKERRANLDAFRRGEISLLVATDLGGRGLDIERIDRVINVHLPTDLGNYRHRAGRTARAGRPGLVVNLVTQRDKPLLEKLKSRGG